MTGSDRKYVPPDTDGAYSAKNREEWYPQISTTILTTFRRISEIGMDSAIYGLNSRCGHTTTGPLSTFYKRYKKQRL